MIIHDESNTWTQPIHDSGRRPQLDADNALVERLGVIEQLLLIQCHPDVFKKILDDLSDGLKQGLSSQFILRFLQSQQPLYNHLVPQEQALVASLSEITMPFLKWLQLKERTSAERHPWIDRFESMASIQQASAFFGYLLEKNISTVNDDLMEVFLSKPEKKSPSRHLYVNRAEELPVLVGFIEHYQHVDPELQQMILPLIVDAKNNNVPIKKLERLLSLLASVQAQLLPLFHEQFKLLRKWWSFAEFDHVPVELASQALKTVLHVHDVKEHPGTVELIDTMIQAGIDANISAEKWSIGITLLDFLKSLTPESLRNQCAIIAQQEKPRFFEDAWMMRFRTINTLQADVLATLSDEDALRAMKIYMQCSDEDKGREYLTILAKMTQPLVAHSVMLERASRLEEPLPYLQAISELQQLYLNLPEQGRDAFIQLFDKQCSDDVQLLRDKDFLQLFNDVPNLNHDYLKNAYALWHKKPYCSMIELKEKMAFSLKIQNQLPRLNAGVLQEIVNAPQQKKELVQQQLLNRQMPGKDVAAWWSKINTHQALQDPLYLHQVMELQKQVVQLTDKGFDDLLDFDDQAKTDKRRRLLHCVYHKEIVLPKEKGEAWWEKYLRALSEWVNKGISTEPKTKLNQKHHVQAIQSLSCVAFASEELHAIVAPSNKDSRFISDQLKQHLENYQSSYSASWWKSGDRKKLAYDELFSLLKKEGTSYDTVFEALHRVMDGVVKMDSKHSKRNSKGYSRLYDIAVQLMSITLSQALYFDATRSHEYMTRVQDIMVQHRQLIEGVDLELPAFQHLQDMLNPIKQPGFNVR